MRWRTWTASSQRYGPHLDPRGWDRPGNIYGFVSPQLNKHVEQLDESRREEAKRYYMMKEHERREYVKSLSEEQRRVEEQRHRAAKLKRANHRKINHPVRSAEPPPPGADSAGLTQLCFQPGE